MPPRPRSEVQCPSAPPPRSTGWMFHAGFLCLVGTVLSAGCVSSERLDAEKVRSLNFQRLLVQEEKRTDALKAQLEQKNKEIGELNAELKETQNNVASLESQNRDLTVELNALKDQGQPGQEPVPASPDLSKDSGEDALLSEPSLSDPFLSEEELTNMLETEETQ